MPRKVSKDFLRRLTIFCSIGLVSIFVILLIYYSLIIPLFIGLFLAYLLTPLRKWFEVRWKLGHNLSVGLSILVLICVLTLLFVSILPVLIKQIYVIVEMLPRAKEHVMSIWIPRIRELLSEIEFFKDVEIDSYLREFEPSTIGQPILNALQEVFDQTGTVLTGLFNIILIPIVTFFILKDWFVIKDGLRSLVPEEFLPGAITICHEIDQALKSVLKGQGLVASMLGILYIIGFSVIGLHNSVAVGAIAGVCRLVPYLDVVVGLLLSFIIIITDPGSYSWGLPIGVAVVIIVVQSIDGMFLTPRVMGEKAGLHAGIVIASVLGFSYWLGFWGVLIAIPVIAIAKVLLQHLIRLYRNTFLGGAP